MDGGPCLHGDGKAINLSGQLNILESFVVVRSLGLFEKAGRRRQVIVAFGLFEPLGQVVARLGLGQAFGGRGAR